MKAFLIAFAVVVLGSLAGAGKVEYLGDPKLKQTISAVGIVSRGAAP